VDRSKSITAQNGSDPAETAGAYIRIFSKLGVSGDGEAVKETTFWPVMALLMSEYGLKPEYILHEMTYPQVISAYDEAIFLRTGERPKRKPVEESEEEILDKFRKNERGEWE